jgi:hypothetical protein
MKQNYFPVHDSTQGSDTEFLNVGECKKIEPSEVDEFVPVVRRRRSRKPLSELQPMIVYTRYFGPKLPYIPVVFF